MESEIDKIVRGVENAIACEYENSLLNAAKNSVDIKLIEQTEDSLKYEITARLDAVIMPLNARY
jgi:hypothetical protein